jgi:hypothetical protein
MVLPIAALMIGLGVKNKMASDDVAMRNMEDDRAFEQERRARQRDQWQRDDALRASMEQAGKPVTVDAAPVATPIGSRDEPRAPEDQGMRVGGDTYTDPMAAAAAAKKANTPEATMERQAAVMSAAGKPMEAAQLRTANRAEQLGKIQLDDAQTAHLNKLYDADLNKVGSWADFATFINGTKGDGQGGGVQVEAAPSADGKTITISRVNPDGTKVVTDTFKNTSADLTKAKALWARSVSPEAKLTHLHQQATEEHAAATLAETTRHNQALEKNQGDLTAARIEMAQMRLDAAKAKGAAGTAPAPLWDDKADAFLRSKYVVKDEATGVVSVDGAGMAFAKAVALARARGNGGDTTIAIGQAMDIDQKLKAAAKGDAAKLDALRQQYINVLTAPPKQEPTTKPDPAIRNAPPGSVTRTPAGYVATGAPAAPAPTAPAASMESVAAPAQSGLPPGLQPSGNEGLDQILAANMAAIQPLNDAVQEASQQLSAAGKSGDPKAVRLYADRLATARAARDAMARQKFGNNADAYLKSLPV